MAAYGVPITLTYTAWDETNKVYKTGDVANHTLSLIRNGVATPPTNTPAEVSSGKYRIAVTAAEAQCLSLELGGTSSTSGVVLIGPTVLFDRLPNVAPGESGGLPLADVNGRVKSDLERWKGAEPATLLDTDKVPVRITGYGTGLSPGEQVDVSGLSTFDPTSDEVILAEAQPSYAPAKAGDAMALTGGERSTLAGVIWSALTSGLNTLGSIGKLIIDNLNATVGSRAVPGAAMTLTEAEREATAGVVDARLLSAGDATDLIAGIITRLNNTNIDQAVLVAALRADIERTGGHLAVLLDRLTATRAAKIDFLDAAITTRSTYAGSDTAGTTTLLDRLTPVRAGYLDKLNVPGTLANTGNAGSFMANVSGLLTANDFNNSDAVLAGTRMLTMIEPDGSVYRFTTNALERAPAGGGGDSAWTSEQVSFAVSQLGILTTGVVPQIVSPLRPGGKLTLIAGMDYPAGSVSEVRITEPAVNTWPVGYRNLDSYGMLAKSRQGVRPTVKIPATMGGPNPDGKYYFTLDVDNESVGLSQGTYDYVVFGVSAGKQLPLLEGEINVKAP